MHDSDPEGKRLPIKLDTTSNGEFAPVPLWPANLEANRLAHEAAATNAKRLGCSKRAFLTSACGAASTLLAFNAANAAAGRTGGFFDLPREPRSTCSSRARRSAPPGRSSSSTCRATSSTRRRAIRRARRCS